MHRPYTAQEKHPDSIQNQSAWWCNIGEKPWPSCQVPDRTEHWNELTLVDQVVWKDYWELLSQLEWQSMRALNYQGTVTAVLVTVRLTEVLIEEVHWTDYVTWTWAHSGKPHMNQVPQTCFSTESWMHSLEVQLQVLASVLNLSYFQSLVQQKHGNRKRIE